MFNVVTFLTKIESLLNKNNTISSSYDISDSLNKRVQRFYKGTSGMHTSLPVIDELYPCVFVEMDSKEEDWSQIGNSARRNMEIRFNIIPVVNYGMGATTDETAGRELSNIECIQVTQNIEYLLREKITLSQTTIQWNKIENTDYSQTLNEENTYNSMGIIRCVAHALSD
jgi:hypothetical protein